jgi:hypothetical protein
MKRLTLLAIVGLAACGKKQEPPPHVVTPDKLVRVRGDATIQPDAETAKAIAASGRARLVTSWKICIDPTGAVDEVAPITSSGFVSWDAALAAGIRTWRYQPFVDARGTAVRACTAQTFTWSPK